MKREGFLFDKIIDKKNIEEAVYRSSRNKLKRVYVKEVLANVEICVDYIYGLLSEKKFVPSKYNVSTIFDGLNKKQRTISKPRYFPDQVIHYCLMNVLEPILLRKMYYYSCGSIVGKGTSFGHKHLRKWLDTDVLGTKYCLKMDIKKFYPSIDKTLLKKKFEKIIKDKDCLWLINTIIDSDCEGVPLGNYTSGFFANYFLTDLDFYIIEKLKIKYYVRYVDDLVILGSNKKELRKVLIGIEDFLKKERLIVKENYQIFNLNYRDIDFLGYRFFRNKTILRKRNMFRISRKVRKVAKKKVISLKDACGIVSYYGWLKHSDSYCFYQRRVKPYVSLFQMKKIISDYTKKNM